MCGTCGCSADGKATIIDLEKGEHTHIDANGNVTTHSHHHSSAHHHSDAEHQAGAEIHSSAHDHSHADDHRHAHAAAHSHAHAHSHSHSHSGTQADGHSKAVTIPLEQAIMQKNDQLAARNRAWFAGREILALNLVSSPGSGKTSILERTIIDGKGKPPIYVIEGDQQTANDAERIKNSGAPSVQINTGTGCHLEADMVMEGLKILKPLPGSVVMIENVGNLVCPALFDLGEMAKVAILSVTEGEDKPIKYPHMFQASDLMLLNKIDLLPHLDFDLDAAIKYAKQVNPDIEIIQISARSGEGMQAWYDWCNQKLNQVHEQAFA